jgi:hypothetical protein
MRAPVVFIRSAEVHDPTNEVNPQRWQTCCEPGTTGIDEFSHKQFRANSKDFCFHKLSPCWKGSVADSHCERI